MSFLKKLFAKPAPPPQATGMDDHLVRLHIPVQGQMGSDEEFDRWTELQEVLNEAAEAAGVGYCDGNEIGGEHFTIWMYGKDAQPLADLVRKVALDHNLPPGCFLFIRHGGVGDPNAKEETLSIT